MNKLNVFVIYQGRNAKNAYDSMIKEFKIFSDSEIASFIILSENNTSSDFIEDKLKKAIRKCDFAIALIDIDERNTLEGGNLWYEIGMFKGLRNRSDLFVFKNKKIDKLISDYEITTVYKEFENYDELKEMISTLLAKEIKQRLEANEKKNDIEGINKEEKIHLTYKTSHNELPVWRDNKSYNCVTHSNFCDSKLDLLSYSSELIAINFEKDIIHCLYEFVNKYDEAVAQFVVVAERIIGKQSKGAPLELRERKEWNDCTKKLKDICDNFIDNTKQTLFIGRYVAKNIDNVKLKIVITEFFLNRAALITENDKIEYKIMLSAYFDNIFEFTGKYIGYSNLSKINEHAQLVNNISRTNCIFEDMLNKYTANLNKSIGLYIKGITDCNLNPTDVCDAISITEKILPHNAQECYNFWNDKKA